MLYACSPILKYGKYSHKCSVFSGPFECAYITVNPDSTFHRYVWYDVGGGSNWTGKWSRTGNTLYAEQTMDSLTLMDSIDNIILLELMQLPYRDTFIIKKNRLIEEIQRIKWKDGNEWGTGEFIFKNSGNDAKRGW